MRARVAGVGRLLIYNSCMSEGRGGTAVGSRARGERLAVVLALALAAGCGSPPLHMPGTLAVTDVTTGWLDVGLDDLGRSKLVPTISFRLRNISDSHVRTLQLNGVFRRCQVGQAGEPPVSEVSPADAEAGTCAGEVQEWGNAYVRAVGREGLDPGALAGPFTMESGLGYTGEQPRVEMLQHRDFVDVKVELFIKHRADPWVRLGEHPIDRQLLTQ